MEQIVKMFNLEQIQTISIELKKLLLLTNETGMISKVTWER